MRGEETFLTAQGEAIVVAAGEMILLPRNVFTVSNFVSAEGPLEAFLVFFDQRIVADFQRQSPLECSPLPTTGAYKVAAHSSLRAYMTALHEVYQGLSGSPGLLHSKLMELLHLIELLDQPGRLSGFLHEGNLGAGKRNIRHLLREHQARNLMVKDLAALSGRSVSAFNREFKRQFGVPPRQWLLSSRLESAHERLLTTGASVTDIGFDVGYNNTSHFIAQFKRKYGITPSRLRLAVNDNSGQLN